MSETPAEGYSRDEIESLAEKIEAFAASLPEREQEAFALLLRKAATASERSGREAAYGSPVAAHVARAVRGGTDGRAVYEEIFILEYEPIDRLKVEDRPGPTQQE